MTANLAWHARAIGFPMAPRPPNYSHERSQRERAQRAKADEKAQKQAEKTARRKALNEGAAPDVAIGPGPIDKS